MPNRSSKSKRPEEVTPPSTPEQEPEGSVRAAATMLGRLGGLKGGTARAASLTPAQRREVARRAARVRWAKEGK